MMAEYENLKLSGFEFQLIENRYFRFYKSEAKRVLIIGGGNVESPKINNIDCLIHFNEVEHFFENNENDFRRVFSLINHNQILNDSLGTSIMKEKFPFEIDQHELHKVSELFEWFHEEVASIFFAKWKDIRSFLPYLEIEFDDHLRQAHLFKGSGLFYKMIIWKLCGHPRTDEYINFHNERIRKYVEANPSKQSLEALNEYEAIRDKVVNADQIYEWDIKYLEVHE